MALILNIDTAVEIASVCLARGENQLAIIENVNQIDHASWIHEAIDKMIRDSGLTMKELDAVAVSSGPGSYTGLRVAMSTGKGICYALNIPLITISTLDMMASAAITGIKKISDPVLLCPMIDARRMEVFTALYNKELHYLVKPCACILNELSFAEYLTVQKIVFYGNGSYKFKRLLKHGNAIFTQLTVNASNLIPLSFSRFQKKDFADLAYCEPLYLKEFYTPFQGLK